MFTQLPPPLHSLHAVLQRLLPAVSSLPLAMLSHATSASLHSWHAAHAPSPVLRIWQVPEPSQSLSSQFCAPHSFPGSVPDAAFVHVPVPVTQAFEQVPEHTAGWYPHAVSVPHKLLSVICCPLHVALPLQMLYVSCPLAVSLHAPAKQ